MKKLLIIAQMCILVVGCSKSDISNIAKASDQPTSYDDCILKYVKPGMDLLAVNTIKESCRKQFDRSRDLTVDELKQISGNFKPGHRENVFIGNLYNGNRTVNVSKLEVQVKYSVDGQAGVRNFFVDTSIGPMSAKEDVFLQTSSDITSKTLTGWSFISGRGGPVE